MALSSLSVVGNANRLRRHRPAPLPEGESMTYRRDDTHHYVYCGR
jgi:hypothetical protein